MVLNCNRRLFMTATDQNLGKQSFEYDQNDRNLMKSSSKSSFFGFLFRNVIVKWKNVPFLEHNVVIFIELFNWILWKWQNCSSSEFVDKMSESVPKWQVFLLSEFCQFNWNIRVKNVSDVAYALNISSTENHD